MSIKQIIAVITLTFLAFLALGHIENFTFGLMDNAPMLILMLMGLDPDGWLGDKLARFKISPAFLACGVAMFVNTFTDGLAASLDANAAFFGVVLGCLVPIAFLPIVSMLKRNEPSKEEKRKELMKKDKLIIALETVKLWKNCAYELTQENESLREALGFCDQCDDSGNVQGFDSYVDCECNH